MSADRVLIAFASPNGSTAGIAETIAAELRGAGLAVDCRPVADVDDLAPYAAVVLGSGVFLARRRSDGGGFLARHAGELARKPVWLYSAGPIGSAEPPDQDDPLADEPAVVRVAHAIDARGAATFGSVRVGEALAGGGAGAEVYGLHARVRAWAGSIADELRRSGVPGGAAGVRGVRARRRPGLLGPRPAVVPR
jgi:menaquinone-dependent protoporphyrinogen oxidase